MNAYLIVLALMIVQSLSCKNKNKVYGQFSSTVDKVTRNNKQIFEGNVKSNAASLKNVYMRETQQNIELLLAQFIDIYGEQAAILEGIAHNAISFVADKIDSLFQVRRRCLLLMVKGLVSNIVEDVLFSGREKTDPKYREMMTNIRAKANKEKKHRKHVGTPRKIKPKVDQLPKDYRGYARDDKGYPVLIVQQKKNEPIECHADYVLDFDESLKDLITDEVNSYLSHYKYRAKLKKNIKQFLPTLKLRCKKYAEVCLKKLEKCTDVCDAIEIVLDESDRKLENIVQRAVEKY